MIWLSSTSVLNTMIIILYPINLCILWVSRKLVIKHPAFDMTTKNISSMHVVYSFRQQLSTYILIPYLCVYVLKSYFAVTSVTSIYFFFSCFRRFYSLCNGCYRICTYILFRILRCERVLYRQVSAWLSFLWQRTPLYVSQWSIIVPWNKIFLFCIWINAIFLNKYIS